MGEELESDNLVSCDNVKIELLENAVHESKKPFNARIDNLKLRTRISINTELSNFVVFVRKLIKIKIGS